MEDTLMALPLRLGGMGILSHPHDSVARILHSTLKTIDPTAEHEPHSFEGRRRNDIRLRGSFKWSVDFDVKVYTLLGSKATKTTIDPADGISLPLHIVQQATKYLEQIERRAIQARPLTNGRFIALVFSAGGMMSEATGNESGAHGGLFKFGSAHRVVDR